MRRTKDATQPNHVIEVAPRAAVVSKPPGYLLVATCERRRPWFASSRERLYCAQLFASLRKGLRHVASRDRTCARGADGCFSSPGAFSGLLRRHRALSPRSARPGAHELSAATGDGAGSEFQAAHSVRDFSLS